MSNPNIGGAYQKYLRDFEQSRSAVLSDTSAVQPVHISVKTSQRTLRVQKEIDDRHAEMAVGDVPLHAGRVLGAVQLPDGHLPDVEPGEKAGEPLRFFASFPPRVRQ